MKRENPYALLKQSAVVLKREDNKAVVCEVAFRQMSPSFFVVLDCYPTLEPKHPERHLGWFRFENIRSELVRFHIRWRNGALDILQDESIVATDSWYGDSSISEPYPFSLRVVIRNSSDQALVFEDRLIVFESEEDFCRIRNICLQDREGQDLPLSTYVIDQNMSVFIVLQNLRIRDAVSNLAWQQVRLFRRLGLKADLFVAECDDYLRPFVSSVSELWARENANDFSSSLLIYHYSIADDTVDAIAALPCKKVAYYHGVTEGRYFRAFDAELSDRCRMGWERRHALLRFDGIIANSRYSLDQLFTGGPLQNESLPQHTVNPPLMGVFERLEHSVIDEDLQQELDYPFLLYVGRVFPHKKIEDLLEIFVEAAMAVPGLRLVVAGQPHHAYMRYLEHRASLLSADIKRRIVWLEDVSDAGLKTLYQKAQVLVSASVDEGFGIPLLEAMYFNVPVVAAAAGAVTEVLGGAGKIYNSKDKKIAAQEIVRLCRAPEYRERVVRRQLERLSEFTGRKHQQEFLDFVLKVYYGL